MHQVPTLPGIYGTERVNRQLLYKRQLAATLHSTEKQEEKDLNTISEVIRADIQCVGIGVYSCISQYLPVSPNISPYLPISPNAATNSPGQVPGSSATYLCSQTMLALQLLVPYIVCALEILYCIATSTHGRGQHG